MTVLVSDKVVGAVLGASRVVGMLSMLGERFELLGRLTKTLLMEITSTLLPNRPLRTWFNQVG